MWTLTDTKIKQPKALFLTGFGKCMGKFTKCRLSAGKCRGKFSKCKKHE